jgi:predicted ArsR family transcriptional regulator
MAFERPPEVTDPKAMRALAHPVRLALLEALTVHEQLTATEAGEIVGESPANASFHLRQLAKYGFVEEAPAGAGRRRPWKRVALGMRFTEVHDDPETAAAARELSRTMSSRYLERAARGLDENRSQPDEWRRVTGWNQMGLYLTPTELEELDEAIVELMYERFGERRVRSEATPKDAERVEILTFAYRV